MARTEAALLGLLVLLALCLRLAGFGDVFTGEGEVLLRYDDASYHARRAYYTFKRFPRVLLRDPLLAHPDGAPVPWPPLYDWALGAAARAAGRSDAAFERTLALTSPVLGALALVPVHLAGRALGGWPVGLGAAALLALLPIALQYSDVGNPDHHAAVALLGAWYLAGSILLARRGRTQRTAWGALLVGARIALVATWNGSLLYLVVGEGALLVAALVSARADLLRAQACGALATAAALAPLVAWVGTPIGGPFATTALSWIQPLALGAVGLLAGGLAVLESRRPAPGVARALGRAGLLGAGIGVLALALPDLRHGIVRALSFVGASDAWAQGNVEQEPLFSRVPSPSTLRPLALYGFYAWLIPLAALAPLARGRLAGLRESCGVLAVWALAMGALALGQVRFGNDFAPAGAVCFALGLAEGGRWLARARPRLRPLAAGAPVLLGLGLLLPALLDYHLLRLRREIFYHSPAGRARDRALDNPHTSLARFARTVREVTPETAGFLDPGARPEYAILAPPSFGHVLHYPARRATPADNFGTWLDAAKFEAAQAFYAAVREEEALAILASLGARYVLTTGAHTASSQLVAHRLQLTDGAARGVRRLEHFRLVAEGPTGGRGFPEWRSPPGIAPFKLFERVEGAVLEIPAAPGEPVIASLDLDTDAGRRITYAARALADADGRARLRVPYASEPVGRLRPAGGYRVLVGGRAFELQVPDAAVLRGAVVRPEPAPGYDE